MSGTRRRAAVLGSPVAHSLSPVLHRAAYAHLGLADWSYDRFDVDESGLAEFLDGLGPQWAGLSLTMPLKRAVIPLLDEVSATARSVEAVNTVVFTRDGRRLGDTTDIPGIAAALRERGVRHVDSATLLGGGATASSALAALATGICAGEVVAYVRSPRRAAEMRERGERLGVRVRTRNWADAPQGLSAPLVVATTPAGVTDALVPAVPPGPRTLFDVLYSPWPTALAARWSARGGSVLGGLDLLVHQAVLQVERMTGRDDVPRAVLRRAGLAALDHRARRARPKAVVIGPMGVGKSTVGALVAERLGCGFRDTDADIETAERRTITDIFTAEGEGHFRTLEKAAVAAALAEHTGVLALGGGAVLAEETRELLAEQTVVLLTMDVEEAVKRTGLNAARPLLAVNPRKRWRELMEARRHLYEEVATVVVATDGRTPEEVAEAALDALELKEA